MNAKHAIEVAKQLVEKLGEKPLDKSMLREIEVLIDIGKSLLDRGGDINAPICCWETEKIGKEIYAGCGYVDENGNYIHYFLGHFEDFLEYCKECRKKLREEQKILKNKLKVYYQGV